MAPRSSKAMWQLGQLSEEGAALLEKIMENEGDITGFEEDLQSFKERFEDEHKQLLNDLANMLKSFESIGKAQEENAKRNAQLAKTNLGKAERIKAFMFKFMQDNDLKTVETGEYKLNIQKASSRSTILMEEFYDADGKVVAEKLPEEYRRVEWVPRMDDIRELLKNEVDDIDGYRVLYAGGKPIAQMNPPSLFLRIY